MKHALHIQILLLGILAVSCARDSAELSLSGTLESDEIDLLAPFTAELREIRVREGETVNTGDTLAALDTITAASAYHAAVAAAEQARAQLADLEAGSDKEKIRAAEARLTATQATLEQRARDLERAETLHKQQLIDDKSLELARLAHNNADAEAQVAAEQLADLRRGARIDQISAARSALQRAEAELAARKKALQDAFLLAPQRGVVQLLPYQLGERVPAGRSALTIRKSDSLWALVYLPEARLANVNIGDPASFTVDAAPDKQFSGTVVYISPSAEFTPRNVQSADERRNLVFAVKIAVSPGQTELRSGMPADFTFGAQ